MIAFSDLARRLGVDEDTLYEIARRHQLPWETDTASHESLIERDHLCLYEHAVVHHRWEQQLARLS